MTYEEFKSGGDHPSNCFKCIELAVSKGCIYCAETWQEALPWVELGIEDRDSPGSLATVIQRGE